MTCEECQENLSQFLDDEADRSISESVQTHLSVCAECAKLCEDFAVILDSCRVPAADERTPPNPDALWRRINNIIESEGPAPDAPPDARKRSVRGYTFSQLASAVIGIALISSLLTIVGTRNYFEPSGEDSVSRSRAEETTFEKVLSKVGLIESPQEARLRRLQEQQAVIDYWNKRVMERRSKWDAHIRDAFDRNVREIDQAVSEYTIILQKDPQDELSGEMLDSALTEKVNLLRAFSEL
ncbi:MAG: anti-sigma factor [Pyrinomonadaceae bacterium]